MVPSILIVDTYYPDFLKSVPLESQNYGIELRRLLDRCFGTFDAYSRNLRACGWFAHDVIANHADLQELWAQESHWYGGDRLEAQIAFHDPDVIFMQDLSLDVDKRDRLLAGQCSCPWPGDEKIRKYDVIFTSFPHYVERIQKLGVRPVYNPLAFEPGVADRCHPDMFPVLPTESIAMDFGRIHDVVFIGGVGNPSHWRYGMEVLEAVACHIPTFKWWGYGAEALPPDSALREKYQGEAWGLDMYEILLQSKICLNRHGEIAQGYANNMRLFEATGCGALLLTEEAANLQQFFGHDEVVTYYSPQEAVAEIRYYLKNEDERRFIAANGQRRTLRDHTYAQRMTTVSETLKGSLCPT